MKIIILLCSFFIGGEGFGFDYFGDKINYWEKDKKHQSKSGQKEEIKDKTIQKKKPTSKQTFDWSKYMDPKNKEFFKEGNHLPPEPLMEVARDPSDENIKNWFAMMEAKNKLMAALQARLSQYVKNKKSNLKPAEKELLEEKVTSLDRPKIDIKRYRFRLYFESSCPHCKKMIATMKELQALGYYVEIRQIDRNKPNYDVPFPLIPATKKELSAKKINSWPVLFAADTDKEIVYRMNGYLPLQNVLNALSKK